MIRIALAFMLFAMACGTVSPPTTEALAGEPPTATAAVAGGEPTSPPAAGVIAKNPSHSSPIAISDDDSLLVVASNLNGNITVFNVANDANAKLAEIPTGDFPRTVVISPDKRFAYAPTRAAARSRSSTWPD